MAVVAIVQDEKALSIPCKETALEDARIVIHHLMDTAHYHRKTCAGLAANQIGFNLRVFVVKFRGKFIAFINPSFEGTGPIIDSVEGCLSFPGKETKVKRFAVIVTTPPKGKRKGLTLSDTSARAFQHEIDHLNGIII